MSSYGPLARWYDSLTQDVPYEQFADYLEAAFKSRGKSVKTVLDLACGTGTLTCMLARRGFELIAVDASPDMLSVAAEKSAEEFSGFADAPVNEAAKGKPEAEKVKIPPMFLCQELTELDLYGTVDAAVCTLDALNYIPADELTEVFRRLHLFLEPGGIFIFDIHSPERLRALDGEIFIDETEDMLCLWRAQFDDEENALIYGVDIFASAGEVWQREQEEHVEYAHYPETLRLMLEAAGFEKIDVRADGPGGTEGRLFIIAENREHKI